MIYLWFTVSTMFWDIRKLNKTPFVTRKKVSSTLFNSVMSASFCFLLGKFFTWYSLSLLLFKCKTTLSCLHADTSSNKMKYFEPYFEPWAYPSWSEYVTNFSVFFYSKPISIRRCFIKFWIKRKLSIFSSCLYF